MNFCGQDAISRETRTTSRSLLTASALLYAVKSDLVDASDAQVLGISLHSDAVERGLFWLVLFLLVSHLVQWYSDYTSYRGWNIAGKKIVVQQYLGSKEAVSILDAVGANIENLLKEGHEITKKEEFARLSSTITSLRYYLSDFDKSLRAFGRYAFFYVVVWFLILPVGFAFFALLA